MALSGTLWRCRRPTRSLLKNGGRHGPKVGPAELVSETKGFVTMNPIHPTPAGRRLGLRGAAAVIGLASLGGIALAMPELNFDRPAQADNLPAMSPLPSMN